MDCVHWYDTACVRVYCCAVLFFFIFLTLLYELHTMEGWKCIMYTRAYIYNTLQRYDTVYITGTHAHCLYVMNTGTVC